MADEIDVAADRIEAFRSDALRHVLSTPVVAGEPGECAECGEDSKRLVGGRCAPCRDGR